MKLIHTVVYSVSREERNQKEELDLYPNRVRISNISRKYMRQVKVKQAIFP